MIKTKQEKQEFVKSFEKEITEAKNFCFAGYQGLTVKELEDLRKKVKSTGAEFRVIKNRLVAKVLKNLKIDNFDEHLKGATAIILEKGDPVKTIKTLSIFSKNNNKLKIKAGYFDNKFLSANDVARIASLPSKEQLVAQVVFSISSPLVRLMNVLTAPMRNLIGAIKNYQLKMKNYG
ncbi:MAG: 50S ribosomal protein L10 [Elusimicrobiota bacterium]|nr:50S ribosomal protein L10 [Elusimicrobiota bacterium]